MLGTEGEIHPYPCHQGGHSRSHVFTLVQHARVTYVFEISILSELEVYSMWSIIEHSVFFCDSTPFASRQTEDVTTIIQGLQRKAWKPWIRYILDTPKTCKQLVLTEGKMEAEIKL